MIGQERETQASTTENCETIGASTKKNDRRGSLWVACDFMDMGVMSAEAIQDTDWLELVERYRAGQTRSGNPLTEGSIRKRKEALVQMLKAMKLNETLAFVQMWKEKKEVKEITYWNLEETEAMHHHALDLAQDPKTLKLATLHFLHYHIAPSKERFVYVQMGVHRFG